MGCYQFTGEKTNTDLKDFKNVDVQHSLSFPIRYAEDQEYPVYFQNVANSIEKDYLKTIKDRIAKEHIVLPAIILNQFISSEFVPKPNDMECRKRLEDTACDGLTKLTVILLKRINLFKDVETKLQPNTPNSIIATIYIGTFSYGKSTLFGPYYAPTLVLAFSTLGIISPESHYVIISLKCKFSKNNKDILTVQSSGGAYLHTLSVWQADQSTLFDNMYDTALGSAYEKLLMSIIDNKEKFTNQTSENPQHETIK